MATNFWKQLAAL